MAAGRTGIQRIASRIVPSGALALAVCLAGCSTLNDMAGIARPGHQPDGSYVLLEAERELDCRQLADRIELDLSDMANARAALSDERSAPAPTLVRAYRRAFGGPDAGLKNAERYDRKQRHARAFNAELARKGCHTLDLDTRFAAIEAAPAASPAMMTPAVAR